MKDLIDIVWNMPAVDFIKYSVIVIFFLIFVYEILTEIRTSRVKRFTRK